MPIPSFCAAGISQSAAVGASAAPGKYAPGDYSAFRANRAAFRRICQSLCGLFANLCVVCSAYAADFCILYLAIYIDFYWVLGLEIRKGEPKWGMVSGFLSDGMEGWTKGFGSPPVALFPKKRRHVCTCFRCARSLSVVYFRCGKEVAGDLPRRKILQRQKEETL